MFTLFLFSGVPELCRVPQQLHVWLWVAVQRPRDDSGDTGGEGGSGTPRWDGHALPGHGRSHRLQLPGRGLHAS